MNEPLANDEPDTDDAADAALGLNDVLELFSKYQRRLYLYIRAMCANSADADDVLQETNIVVWKKFGQFRPGTDFRAWVFQIAYFEVRKMQARKRKQGFTFSEELCEQLAQDYDGREDELENRVEVLEHCVEKLPTKDRALVKQIYAQQTSVVRLSEQTGREKTSIYRSLRRIRQLLFKCIESTLLASSERESSHGV